MFSNCEMSVRRPLYFIVNWKVFGEFSPNEPVGDSKFCSPKALVMSDGTKPYCAMTSGFSQMRKL